MTTAFYKLNNMSFVMEVSSIVYTYREATRVRSLSFYRKTKSFLEVS